MSPYRKSVAAATMSSITMVSPRTKDKQTNKITDRSAERHVRGTGDRTREQTKDNTRAGCLRARDDPTTRTGPPDYPFEPDRNRLRLGFLLINVAAITWVGRLGRHERHEVRPTPPAARGSDYGTSPRWQGTSRWGVPCPRRSTMRWRRYHGTSSWTSSLPSTWCPLDAPRTRISTSSCTSKSSGSFLPPQSTSTRHLRTPSVLAVLAALAALSCQPFAQSRCCPH